MVTQTTADGGRTDTERFSADVDASELIEGDRIARELVARHPDQLGSPLRRTAPNKPDQPDTRLVVVTALRDMDDVHSALLFDPEAELFVRAGRHDRSQAMTQAEADWKVREIGSEIVVEEVHDLERPDDEQDQPAEEYAQEWAEILFDDVRFNGGDADYSDERRLDGSTLELRDVDGRKLVATISLE